MPIRLDVIPVGAIDGDQRRDMFVLMQSYFDGVRWDEFHADLNEKDQVMMLIDSEQQKLVGFSTLMHFALSTPMGEVIIVFSGDTVVDASSRIYCGFGYGLDHYFQNVRQQTGNSSVYYVLISKGWRTYRVMPFLFEQFSPNHAVVTPPRSRMIINAFGQKKYPGQFDPHRGLIFGKPEGQRIRPDGPDVVSVHRLADPHIRFFALANPGHINGDELVCLANTSPDNYTAAFRRMIRRHRGNQT